MLTAQTNRVEALPPASSPRSLRSPRERYDSEIRYFDREAEEAAQALRPIDPMVLARYQTNARRRFNKEFRLSLLGPLAGKKILEIGCGDGEAAVLLAKLGAEVTGVDISPKSIELARARAALAGVTARTQFRAAPLADADLPASGYDAIWGDGILHHVIDDLDVVMANVVRWGRPGAKVIIAEPVNLSPSLRRIRLMLPVPLEGTPDERPLEPRELAVVQRHLPDVRVRPFMFLSRLSKFILRGQSYERAAPPRRAMDNVLNAIDAVVLSVPGLRRLAGQVVMHATIRK